MSLRDTKRPASRVGDSRAIDQAERVALRSGTNPNVNHGSHLSYKSCLVRSYVRRQLGHTRKGRTRVSVIRAEVRELLPPRLEFASTGELRASLATRSKRHLASRPGRKREDKANPSAFCVKTPPILFASQSSMGGEPEFAFSFALKL